MTDTRARSRIRTIVVDDEPPARRLLASLVRRDSELELVGEHSNGAAALASISAQAVDLVLLDVQMPTMDGISFLESLPRDRPNPYVILVTAHDGYAVQAFELEALDYLLKPIEKRRFQASIQRAKEAIRQRTMSELTEQMMQVAMEHDWGKTGDDKPASLIFRKRDQVIDVELDEIVWVEAANQYVRIHTLDGVHVLAESLSAFAKRNLSPRFVRVHRSAVVDGAKIGRIVPRSNGTHRLELVNGDSITLARSRKDLLPRLLQLAKGRRERKVEP